MSKPAPASREAEIAAWLDEEKRRADRWVRAESGVLKFTLTGPELSLLTDAITREQTLRKAAQRLEAFVKRVSELSLLLVDSDNEYALIQDARALLSEPSDA